ncbi:MAG TPA: hypothetical protein VE693_03440 [Gaiellaceae bacterium]|jgi:hypothetical protein|nr:hypothetical protein [Gaiellaceae bacterium]
MERIDRTTIDLWTYGDVETLGVDVASGIDLTGFSVEAIDGSIGKVDEATYETSRSYLVVDTGPWIFGKKVLLPAGVVERIDLDTQTVFVKRTKDEIKNSPEFDEAIYRDAAYRSKVGDYYHAGTPSRTDVR